MSPAKVNLFLQVVRRRCDGYHELASLFQAIDLCDTLHCALAENDQLECFPPIVPVDRSNLIWKAVDLFRRKTGLSFAVHFKLEKRIPVEAGLGGGSSNAATALWAVNALLGSPICSLQLMEWSKEIGSDIPFFFSNGSAYCTGRGEIVRNLEPLPRQKIWIYQSGKGLSTPKVFEALNLETLSQDNAEDVLNSFLSGSPVYFNDLEKPAMALLPELHDVKKHLLSMGFDVVQLTGAGSAFFCLGKKTSRASPTSSFQQECCYVNRLSDSWY